MALDSEKWFLGQPGTLSEPKYLLSLFDGSHGFHPQTPPSFHWTQTRVGGMGNQGQKPQAAVGKLTVFSAFPGSTHILTPQKLLDTLKKLNKTDEETSS